ncbi:CbiM family transporter [Amphibacillus cookii]|uniref:CbiM family transporter n=1 Tax=Amphibacillus cookii TaxID=767787 RepID=UPI00195BE05E|nr:CbiM family transporter [Amphibacillus cookii]MBM7542370.1 cobalt/nickel transport system permease protein [Amphibacillus cookii]
MHVADGVLSLPVAITTTIGAVGIFVYALKGTKEEEIPKISLLAGGFFVASLINIPIGPTSIHPLLGGFIGLILGRRAPLAILVALLLQALLFQHGGITTFGANTLLMSIPALLVHYMFINRKSLTLFWKGMMSGSLAVLIGVGLLCLLLISTSSYYHDQAFSVIQLVWMAYLPLALIEGVLTGFAIKHLSLIRPQLVKHLMKEEK